MPERSVGPGESPAISQRAMHVAVIVVIATVGLALMLIPSASSGSPTNDTFDGATPIESLPFSDGSVDLSTTGVEPDEPQPSCVSPSHTAWYALTPESDTPLTVRVVPGVDAEAAVDVALAVWASAPDGSLVEAACVDGRGVGGPEQLVMAAVMDQSYHLQVSAVDEPDASPGRFTLLADVQLPEHDLFAFARPVGTTPFRDTDVDTIDARREPGESVPSCAELDATTWYGVTAPADGILSATVTSSGSDDTAMDVAMVFYTGETIDTLVELACADDQGTHGPEHLEVPVSEAEDYWIEVGAVLGEDAGPGIFTLTVDGIQAIDLRPVPDTVFGAAPGEISAEASSDLLVTFDADGPCHILKGAVIADGAGLCTVTARQPGDADWAPAQPVATTLRIGRGHQAIDIEPVRGAVVGEDADISATADSGLPVTLEVEGPCRIVDGALASTGAGTCTITASQPGDTDWAPAEPVATTLRIGRGHQAIELAPIAEAFVGEPVEVGAEAGSGLAVTIDVEGPCRVLEGVVLADGAGTCTITASQRGDTDWAPAEPVTTTLRIDRGRQAIELAAPEDMVFGAEAVEISAETNSDLPVSFEAEGPCRILDGALVSTGAGTCIVTASQAGDIDWNAAEPVSTNIDIAPAQQAIDLAPLGDTIFGADPVGLTAAATSDLPVTFDASGACLIENGSLRSLGAGTCTITASQPGDTDWAAAEPITTTHRIGRGHQAIELTAIDETVFGGEPVTIAAETSSDLPVTLQVEGPCLVQEGALVSTGAGTCTVTASQSGDIDWAPAEPITRSVRIARAQQAIELEPIGDTVFGSEPVGLSALSDSGLAVTYEALGPCEVEGRSLRTTGAGACKVTAIQIGDADWAPADPVTASIDIAPAQQAIELEPFGGVRVGEMLTLAADATSDLPVAFDASGACLIESGSLRSLGAGTCTVTASQPGDTDWAPAEPITTTLRIGRGHQAIELTSIDDTVFGAEPLELSAQSDSGLAVAFETDGPCEFEDRSLRSTGAGNCTITASQAGDIDWTPAEPVSTSIDIAPARQAIEFEPIGQRLLGEAPIELMPTATSGLPVTLRASGPCRTSDGALVLLDGGRCTITASQAGDADWAAAPPLAETFRIVAPITSHEPDFTDRVAVSPPGTLVGDGAWLTSAFDHGGPTEHYYAVALDEEDVLEIGGIGEGTTWSIAGPTDLTANEDVWSDFQIDTEAAIARWIAAESGLHSIRVGDARAAADASPAYTMRVMVDPKVPEPVTQGGSEQALIERLRPMACNVLLERQDPRPFMNGALAGVLCRRPTREVSELKVYSFSDTEQLRDYFDVRLDEVRPEVRRTVAACKRGIRGVTNWEHGRVACWIPEDRVRAVLHWTDERTNTYGIIRSVVDHNRDIHGVWRDLIGRSS